MELTTLEKSKIGSYLSFSQRAGGGNRKQCVEYFTGMYGTRDDVPVSTMRWINNLFDKVEADIRNKTES